MRKLLILFFLFLGFKSFAQTDTIRTESGLKYVLSKKGSGKIIQKGSHLTVHYTGWLLDGTMFDTSEGQKPIKLDAGTGQVIKGWDELMLLLHEGDEATVIIPANLAYGDRGVINQEVPGSYLIPPGAPLKFKVRIIEVKKP